MERFPFVMSLWLEIFAGIGKIPVMAMRHAWRLKFEIETELWNGNTKGEYR